MNNALEELKSFVSVSQDGLEFMNNIKNSGYVFLEETPWGSVVMVRGKDKLIVSVKNDIRRGEIFNLAYLNETDNVLTDLVIEGNIVQ